MHPRGSVKWFAEEMERELRNNDHKSGWENSNPRDLIPRIEGETRELVLLAHDLKLGTAREKISPEQKKKLISECADIANFAMMVADIIEHGVEKTKDC